MKTFLVALVFILFTFPVNAEYARGIYFVCKDKEAVDALREADERDFAEAAKLFKTMQTLGACLLFRTEIQAWVVEKYETYKDSQGILSRVLKIQPSKDRADPVGYTIIVVEHEERA